MHARPLAPIAVALLLLSSVRVAPDAEGGRALAERTGSDVRESEVERVHRHLLRAETELRRATPPGLTPAQVEARRETLDWLGEYRLGRAYPHNHLTDRPTPVFVDGHGTPCAVGYLLLRSGEDALVEEIVRTDLLVRVPDLAGDPRLAAWLDRRGLTLEEAALVQPAYRPAPDDPGDRYSGTTVAFSVVSAALVAHGELTERGPGPQVGAFGSLAMTGVHGAMVGWALNDSGDQDAWAVGLNAAMGVVAAVSGVRRLLREPVEASSIRAGLSLAPDGSLRAGVTLRH